jgi:hypothetical protein
MITYQVFTFKGCREMKKYFTTILVKNWAANILTLLVLMLNTGCGIIKSSTSRALEIKPFEEMMEEDHKKLRIAKELTLETEISSRIIISREIQNHNVEYLKANLKILPMIDSRQKILRLETVPSGKVVGRSLEFKLDSPSRGRHEFKLKAEAILKHEFVQVSDKIPFPLQVIPTEQIKYTKPSFMIDSDDEGIKAVASSTAQGEDDLYRVVFKVSKWVRENVQADIDISTVSFSQKASWVLEHRKGVCDEITNLFIGLLRSLGIPVKFIIGLVGTNYNDKINFKPHGWAEVYFPSAGWIPFDVAHNQMGFIDATHIKLTESVDTSESLTLYEWKSPNAFVSVKDLEIKTMIKQITGTITPLLEIRPKVWHRNIDIGSYNVIEATVINPQKLYVITDISLQIPHELKIMGRNTKMILLEPDTRRTLYWIVKPTIDIAKRKIVTFPINVVSSRNASSSMTFCVAEAPGYRKYSFERLKNAVKRRGGTID